MPEKKENKYKKKENVFLIMLWMICKIPDLKNWKLIQLKCFDKLNTSLKSEKSLINYK